MLDRISLCPICSSIESVPETSLYDGDFLCELRRCQGCSLVYLASQLPVEEVAVLEETNPTYIGEKDEKKELSILSELVEFFERYVSPGTILEIGCSRGFLLKAAETRGWQATGVEICKTTAEYARAHFGLTIYNNDLQNCPFPPSHFDLVVLWHTLEHVKQPRLLVSQVARLLRGGGVLAIQVPSYSLVKRSGDTELRNRILCKVHNFQFTKAPLSLLLTQEGFDVSYVGEWEADCSLTVVATKKVSFDASDRLTVLQVNAMAFSEQYRVHNVSEQLELARISHKILNLPDLYADPEMAARLFGDASVIVFHRVAYDSLLEKLCVHARTHGATLVYETDDLTFFPSIDPRWVDGLRYLSPGEVSHYYEGVDRYHRMMNLCDVGLFSTSFLARLAERMGLRSWILRNALGKPYLEAAERAYQQRKFHNGALRIRLGYCSGTKTHDRDFAQFAPALMRLMDKDSKVELAVFGHLQVPVEFSRFESRIQHYAPVPFEKVPEVLASFDINLAPLELFNPFCRGKSELKYFEAGILGIPTVASRTEEFAYAIESGKNGFLVSDDQELEDCLVRLVRDEGLREEVGKTARQDVLVRYTPASRAQELVQILGEIREGTPHS